MANIVRLPKSASAWTKNELDAYRIRIIPQDEATFFGANPLPPPPVAAELLNQLHASNMTSIDNYKVIRYLDLAHSSVNEAAVDDFSAFLLTFLNYTNQKRVLRVGANLKILQGTRRSAKPNISILDEDDLITFIEENKKYGVRVIPEAQLICEAIAAFRYNNTKRAEADRIDAQIFPAIIMSGTWPLFYKIHLTTDLVEAVQNCTYPKVDTIVYRCTPVVPRPQFCYGEGMKPLDNRGHLLACFQQFKQFV